MDPKDFDNAAQAELTRIEGTIKTLHRRATALRMILGLPMGQPLYELPQASAVPGAPLPTAPQGAIVQPPGGASENEIKACFDAVTGNATKGGLSGQSVSNLTSIPLPRVQVILKGLADKGLVKKTGSKATTRWLPSDKPEAPRDF